MPLQTKQGLRGRRLFERGIAVAVGLGVQALLFLSLAHQPVDLGVRADGLTDASFLQLAATPFPDVPTQAVPQKPSPPEIENTEPVEPAPSPIVGVGIGETDALVDEPLGQPEPTVPQTPTIDPVAEELRMASVAAFVAQAANADAGQAGESCKIAEWLMDALRNSEEVATAVAMVPRRSRSVANALMLWNGVWVEPPAAAQAGMTSLKYAVLAGVRTAPPPCLQQPLRGPLLIPVGDDRDTLLLAIGSGEWRWGDLLTEVTPADNKAPTS